MYEKCHQHQQNKMMLHRIRHLCPYTQILMENRGREFHSYIHYMLRGKYSDINYFFQGEMETCNDRFKKSLLQFKNYFKDAEKNETARKNGLFINLKVNFCPWFVEPSPFGSKPEFYREIFCRRWFKKITGTEDGCEDFNASYRGEMGITSTALKNMVKQHEKVLREMSHELFDLRQQYNKMGFYLEMLWPVFFNDYLYKPCVTPTIQNVHFEKYFNYTLNGNNRYLYT